MRHSKSAWAALALLFAGAASAQQSVAIYGRVTTGLVKDTNGQSARIDGPNGTGRLGFRGSEDLGSGLRATFDLQHRFSAESGGNDGTANSRPFWQGVSKVGLGGSFGSVEVGRMVTALQGPLALSDPFGTETVGNVYFLANGYATDPRQADGAGLARSDVVTYNSPNLSGFTASISVGLKTSAAVVPRTVGAKNLLSVWLAYAKGPLYVGGGYERNRFNDDITAVLATYDFGPLKLIGGSAQVDTAALAGPKAKNYDIGFTAPLGAAIVKGGYGNSRAEGTALRTRKIALGVDYYLSKRTYVFSDIARTRPAIGARVTAYDIGISHSF